MYQGFIFTHILYTNIVSKVDNGYFNMVNTYHMIWFFINSFLRNKISYKALWKYHSVIHRTSDNGKTGNLKCILSPLLECLSQFVICLYSFVANLIDFLKCCVKWSTSRKENENYYRAQSPNYIHKIIVFLKEYITTREVISLS